MKNIGIQLLIIFYFLCGACLAQSIDLTAEEIEQIGIKVFDNECAGENECLLDWNEGEDFLSLGIGHFIWYPQGQKGPFEESFPFFIKYLREVGGNVPEYLTVNPFPKCPWSSREEFLKNRQGAQAQELYRLLNETKKEQSAFLISNLNTALPLMLKSAGDKERIKINKQFNRMASTAQGVFALVDYANFKGLGISTSERYKNQGWGLLQVLSDMQGDEDGLKAVEEFVQSADKILSERVNNAPSERQEQRWLLGWQNRMKSYLK